MEVVHVLCLSGVVEFNTKFPPLCFFKMSNLSADDSSCTLLKEVCVWGSGGQFQLILLSPLILRHKHCPRRTWVRGNEDANKKF